MYEVELSIVSPDQVEHAHYLAVQLPQITFVVTHNLNKLRMDFAR